ncbi:MAG: hypothetical protein M1834_001452 [Cirrosporium novae-zelandiae]|nr:MAG: hypothetical protein M1834_001452 [Cirrosporium novae-zelandiae]
MSIRSFTRSVPRSFARTFTASAGRPIVARLQPRLLQTSWKQTAIPRTATFSTFQPRLQKAGEVDEELSAKFESELQLENDARDPDEMPANVKDFIENGPFEIVDIPGQEEVALKRTFGNEQITVRFSVADLNSMDQDPDQFAEDKALYDEEDMDMDAQSGAANTKGAINQGRKEDGNFKVAPEDSVAPADRPEIADEEGAEGEQEPSFPVRLNITIEKAGKEGVIQVETLAHDGLIDIDNIYYWPDAKIANSQTAEKEWQGRNLYTGPPFGNLDEDLQVMMERYLSERGVNTALALFCPDYVDYKEQREYLRWLNNMKSFIDA